MCDLCCTLVFTRSWSVGETLLCHRCWQRYLHLGVTFPALSRAHRVFAVSEAHVTRCVPCARHKSVILWTDEDGVELSASSVPFGAILACYDADTLRPAQLTPLPYGWDRIDAPILV